MIENNFFFPFARLQLNTQSCQKQNILLRYRARERCIEDEGRGNGLRLGIALHRDSDENWSWMWAHPELCMTEVSRAEMQSA